MSSFVTLGVGGGALAAAQSAMTTTSRNISQSEVTGFSRQDVSFSALPGGLGVATPEVISAYDQFRRQAVDVRTSTGGYAGGVANAFRGIEPLFDTSNGGIGPAISRVFDAFDALSADATNDALRGEVVAAGRELAGLFRSADATLAERIEVADQSVEIGVTQLRTSLEEIAALNEEIQAVDAMGGDTSGLRAGRLAALSEVAELVPVRAVDRDDGSLTVLIGGHAVVQGGVARLPQAGVDPATGDVRVELLVGGAVIDLNPSLATGRIGALLHERDTVVPELRTELDQLAFDLATEINNVHVTGFGADGLTGRLFFDTPAAVAGAAGTMTLSAPVDASPDAVAAAPSAVRLYDGSVATTLAALRDGLLAAGGTRTFSGAYADIVADVGLDASAAYSAESRAERELQTALELQAAASAVSVEEEALDLLKFQDAFQAAARVVSVASETLDDLFRLV